MLAAGVRLPLAVQKAGKAGTARSGHRDVSFRSTVRGLPKNHAVAALHVCATPINRAVSTPPCRTPLRPTRSIRAGDRSSDHRAGFPAHSWPTRPESWRRRRPGQASTRIHPSTVQWLASENTRGVKSAEPARGYGPHRVWPAAQSRTATGICRLARPVTVTPRARTRRSGRIGFLVQSPRRHQPPSDRSCRGRVAEKDSGPRTVTDEILRAPVAASG